MDSESVAARFRELAATPGATDAALSLVEPFEHPNRTRWTEPWFICRELAGRGATPRRDDCARKVLYAVAEETITVRGMRRFTEALNAKKP